MSPCQGPAAPWECSFPQGLEASTGLLKRLWENADVNSRHSDLHTYPPFRSSTVNVRIEGLDVRVAGLDEWLSKCGRSLTSDSVRNAGAQGNLGGFVG